MKKIITLGLVGVMLAVSAISASAETLTNKGNVTKNVTTTYTAGGSAATVYSVDIDWGSMEFNYKAESEGTWNPTTHSYDDKSPAAWSYNTGANKITVKNHSNTAVNVSLGFDKALDTNITGAFYDADNNGTVISAPLALATAKGTTVANAPSKDAFFKVTGGSVSANKTVGTIKVTLQ